MLMGGTAGLLLTAVAGYWVMERAERHKNGMRLLGKVIGGLIILASFLGVACMAWCGGGSCGHGMGMKKGGMCPLGTPPAAMSKP